MEKTVQFRDYQKAQTSDFNNLQSFAQQSFDDLVGDAVTASLRYAGFNTVKSNTAELTVAPGRFYGANSNSQIGAIYTLPTQTIISLVQYLAVSQVTQRILTLTAYGVLDQVDVQTRDYLTNTQTLQTQPQSVSMTASRDAVLAIVAGAEAGSPTAPAIGVGQVAVASILVDANGIISVTMLPGAQVISTEELDGRLDVVETFDAQVGPRISSLASDLAALANELNALGNVSTTVIDELMADVANVKDLIGLPAAYSQYGALHFAFMDPTKYDTNNTAALGFNANIFYGCRFPAQNAALFSLALFNPLDPSAELVNGLLLPTYTDNLVLQTGNVASSTSMSQYGFQTFAMVELQMSYTRIVDGPSYNICSNGAVIQNSQGDQGNYGWWLPNFTAYEFETSAVLAGGTASHYWTQVNYYWVDSWTEPYWQLDVTNHSVNGAQIAQTFLVSSDAWITRLGIYISTVASATDIWFTLCKCVNGQPDITQAIAHQSMPGANLVTGWNYIELQPSFCSKGDRMAVVITTAANHQIGMTPAGSYLDGTFFYTLDGAYYLGDFTQEIALRVYAAQFTTNQCTIEFNALNLAGGIRNIDLAARQIIPASCTLSFEVLPAGTASWLPINPTSPLVPFQNAPVLARFRARFVGTSSVMPGIYLPDSACYIWCPGPVFVLVTEPETLAAPSASITFSLVVENFNPTAHSLMASQGNGAGFIKLYKGPGPSYTAINPTTTVVTETDVSTGQYKINCTFSGISPSISSFIAVIQGTTNSVADTFVLSTMTWWAT